MLISQTRCLPAFQFLILCRAWQAFLLKFPVCILNDKQLLEVYNDKEELSVWHPAWSVLLVVQSIHRFVLCAPELEDTISRQYSMNQVDLNASMDAILRDTMQSNHLVRRGKEQKVGFLMVYDWVEKIVGGLRRGTVEFGPVKALEGLVHMLEQDLYPRLEFVEKQEGLGEPSPDLRRVLWKSLIWQLMEHPVGSQFRKSELRPWNNGFC